jgi:putative toxin-antitoxin system antitoxin component (TIGR02293 family)
MADKGYKQKLNFEQVNEADSVYLMQVARQGINFETFINLVKSISFSMPDWSRLLHITDRTMQRYKKDMKSFDTIQSEKILQITLLYKKGIDVFGDKTKFDTWLISNNVALGNIKPKDLLDNAFGINFLNDELIRIEHGVLA